MKLTAATPIDSDYAYIDTFLNFLNKLVTIMNTMFNNLVDGLGKLMKLTEKEEDAE